MTDANTFSTRLTLPYSAVNARGWAKTDWLVNAFQDIASQQHHDLGVSGFHMARQGLKWVVAQYRIRVHEPLNWMTPFILTTRRYPWKNLYETRAFTVTDPAGKVLVSAIGIWVLVKAKNGMPVRLNRYMPPELMNQAPGKDPKLVKSHPPLSFDTPCTAFTVMYHDLDMNQHVNNAVYVKWAVESRADAPEHLPVYILVSYLKECFYPETVHCHVAHNSDAAHLATDHAIVRPETREVLARIAIKWQKVSSLAPLCWHE